MKLFFWICLLVGPSLGKVCQLIGNECANGCRWDAPGVWRECDGGFPANGDAAVIEDEGTYSVLLASSVELEFLRLGRNERENDTQFLELADRAVLTLLSDSQISRGGVIQLGTASAAGGPSTLRNYGTIVSRGESSTVSFHSVLNYGEILVSLGKLSVESALEHHGVLNVSKGEELLLGGAHTFLNGRVHVGVDQLGPNPVVVRGSLSFGDSAVYLVEVYGPRESQFPQILAMDSVTLGGTVRVKLMPDFAPSKHLELSFLSSQVPMEGEMQPQLDVEDWQFPYCVRCHIFQEEKSVGFRCRPCPDEEEDVTLPKYSSWRLPDGSMMSIQYLIPGLALVFVVIVLIMGFVELWVRIVDRREAIMAARGELVDISME